MSTAPWSYMNNSQMTPTFQGVDGVVDPYAVPTEAPDGSSLPTGDDGAVTGHHGVPRVPEAGDFHGSPMAVNTEVLDAFAKNLQAYRPILDECVALLNGITVPAGGFPHAWALKSKAMGPAGSSAATTGGGSGVNGAATFSKAARDAIATLKTTMEQVSALCAQAEQKGTVDATKLDALVTKAGGIATQLSGGLGGAATTTGTGTGTGTGSGSGTGTSTGSSATQHA